MREGARRCRTDAVLCKAHVQSGWLMIAVSNADRVVFPEIKRTKGDVVAYYERIAAKALPHVAERPLSIRRYPKGLAGPGFFQKNVPPHYPASIARFTVPRSKAAAKKNPRKSATDQDVTVYPVVSAPEHLAYLANQGAIELHVPTARRPLCICPIGSSLISIRPPALSLSSAAPPTSYVMRSPSTGLRASRSRRARRAITSSARSVRPSTRKRSPSRSSGSPPFSP